MDMAGSRAEGVLHAGRAVRRNGTERSGGVPFPVRDEPSQLR
jgi:hypothetical protein